MSFIYSFDHKLPLYFSIIVSIFLIVILTGFRGFKTSKCVKESFDLKKNTVIKRLIFNHSHHSIDQIHAGKEFIFNGKYICIGCYGILVGSFCSVIIISVYSINELNNINNLLICLLLPLLFIPIIARYTIWKRMPTILRFFSNVFLPIGCTTLLLVVDDFFQNWWLNTLVLVLVSAIIILRSYVAQKENLNLQCERSKFSSNIY